MNNKLLNYLKCILIVQYMVQCANVYGSVGIAGLNYTVLIFVAAPWTLASGKDNIPFLYTIHDSHF